MNNQTNHSAAVGALEESLVQQGQLQYLLNELRRTVDERAEGIEMRKELGRENVELRAKNMDIERQNHILKDQLHELRHLNALQNGLGTFNGSDGANNLSSLTKSFSHLQANTFANDLIQIKQLIEGLSRSRAIGALSIVAPRPKLDIASALQQINRLIGKLGIS